MEQDLVTIRFKSGRRMGQDYFADRMLRLPATDFPFDRRAGSIRSVSGSR